MMTALPAVEGDPSRPLNVCQIVRSDRVLWSLTVTVLCSTSGRDIIVCVLPCYCQSSEDGKLELLQSIQESALQPGKYSLQKMFEMRLPSGDYGTPLDSMMALQDYYMATMFWAKMSNLSSKRSFYELRLTQYKRLDGNNGRRDMRRELQVTLQSYYRLPRHLS
jgi:hypothetical protein